MLVIVHETRYAEVMSIRRYSTAAPRFDDGRAAGMDRHENSCRIAMPQVRAAMTANAA